MSAAVFQPANITPSDEQIAIQTLRTRLLLVEANAGAAKTTTLALRIAQALQRGAPPDTMLAITTTEPAVVALKDRLRHVGVAKTVIQRIRIQTFEAFSLDVLASAEGSRTQVLLRHEQIEPYVVRAIERAQSFPDERYPDELMADVMPADLVEGLLRTFEVLKGRMVVEHLDADERMTPELAHGLGFGYLTMRVWSCYEFLRRGGHPDRPEFRFSGDGTYDLARMLLTGEVGAGDSLLDLSLSLICVDEMHDVNRSAFTVLKAVLAANPRAAFVGVGDRDQVIHSQSGADAAFMREHFRAEIGEPHVLPLTCSRRFSPQLAHHVGALSSKAYAADEQVHTQLVLEHCPTPRAEAALIANLAQEHHRQTTLASMRVLLRHAAQSVQIEHQLLKRGVPYGAVGFLPYLERPETLLVRGLYAQASGDYSGFEEPVQRERLLFAWMTFSGARVDSIEVRHLDEVQALRAAVVEAAASFDSTRTFIEGHALRSAHPVARRQLEAALAVMRSNDIDVFEASFLRALDPQKLAARVFVREDEAAQVAANIAQLHRIAIAEGSDLVSAFRVLTGLDQARRTLQGNDRVVLSSIEASKGLEFDHVVIPQLSKGEFGDGSTESRNLLYVALTRARRKLTLLFDPQRPSRFLKDAALVE